MSTRFSEHWTLNSKLNACMHVFTHTKFTQSDIECSKKKITHNMCQTMYGCERLCILSWLPILFVRNSRTAPHRTAPNSASLIRQCSAAATTNVSLFIHHVNIHFTHIFFDIWFGFVFYMLFVVVVSLFLLLLLYGISSWHDDIRLVLFKWTNESNGQQRAHSNGTHFSALKAWKISNARTKNGEDKESIPSVYQNDVICIHSFRRYPPFWLKTAQENKKTC